MTRILLALAFAAAVVASAVACDSSESARPGQDGAPEPQPPDEGAGWPDDDAGADADADGSERCTADDFCHTVLPPDQTLRGVWGDDQGIVWAVSEQGAVLRWDGTSWQIRHSNAGRLSAIWGSSATDIWVAGEAGLIHGEGPTSGELTFSSVEVPGLDGIPLHAIAGRSASDIWAVGGRASFDVFPPNVEGIVLHYSGPSSNPGGGWSVFGAAPDMTVLEHAWTTDAGDVWIGGTDHTDFWIALSRGVLLHREAGGDTFSEVALPTIDHPGVPGGRGDIERLTGGTTIGGSVIALGVSAGWGAYLFGSNDPDGGVSRVWQDTTFDVHPSYLLHTVWGASPTDVWLAGDYGRLRHWDGTTWSLPRIVIGKVPVTNAFHAMWARTPDDLWFVGDRIALHKRPSKQ